VRVRDHQDVLGGRFGVEAAIELGQGRRLRERNQLLIGAPEDHVVMAAGRALRRPLVGEERDHATVAVGVGRQALERAPLGVVEPAVVLGQGNEVEPRVLGAVDVVLLGRPLGLGEVGVPVELAPEDARAPALADPDRVRARGEAAVGGSHVEPRHPGRFEGEPAHLGERGAARRRCRDRPAVEDDLPAWDEAGRSIEPAIGGADREREALAGKHQRWREDVERGDLRRALDVQRVPSRGEEVAAPVEIHVERQHQPLGRHGLHREAARAAAAIAIGERHGVAGLEIGALEAERHHRRGTAGASVHAGPWQTERLEHGGGARAADAGVVVPGGVFELDLALVAHEVEAEEKDGAAPGRARARLVYLLERRPASCCEQIAWGEPRRAERGRISIEQCELGEIAIDLPHRRSGGRVALGLQLANGMDRERQIDRQRVAGERPRVAPTPQEVGAIGYGLHRGCRWPSLDQGGDSRA
jgi:hypothetical protein